MKLCMAILIALLMALFGLFIPVIQAACNLHDEVEIRNSGSLNMHLTSVAGLTKTATLTHRSQCLPFDKAITVHGEILLGPPDITIDAGEQFRGGKCDVKERMHGGSGSLYLTYECQKAKSLPVCESLEVTLVNTTDVSLKWEHTGFSDSLTLLPRQGVCISDARGNLSITINPNKKIVQSVDKFADGYCYIVKDHDSLLCYNTLKLHD